jgi:hypothetical protein
MAVTITTKNYLLINACEDATQWTGEAPADVTDFYKEGTQCVGFTVRGTGNNDIYVTGSWDLSGKHLRCWMMTVALKELDTDANGGVQFFLGDGTNTGYYKVSGSTSYPGGWYNLVLDCDRTPDSGSQPTLTAITTIGIRFVHTSLAKNTQNTWIDNVIYCDGLIAYGDIDSGLITINVDATAGTFTRTSGDFTSDGFKAGQTITTTGFTNAGNNTTKIIETVTATVITVTNNSGLVDESGDGDERVRGPFSFADILAKDEDTTNGWGIIRKISGVYYLVGNLEFGDSAGTNSCNFLDTSQIVVFEDRKVDTNLYNFTVVGNATGTTEFQLGNKSGTAGIEGCVIKSEGTIKYDVTCTDTDVDTFKIYGCTFLDADSISLPTSGANREVLSSNFEECGTINVSTCKVQYCKFISAKDDAITISNTSFDVADCDFISPTNHGIEITATGEYDFDNLQFMGTSASGPYDVENTTTGTVIINNLNGSNTQYVDNSGGGTTTINTAVTLSIHIEDEAGNNIPNAQVYIQKETPTAFTADIGNNAGDADLVVNETVDTDIPGSGWVMVWIKSLNEIQPYRYTSWSGKTFTFPTEVTGTCTSTGSSTQLLDTGADFGNTTNVKEGDTIRNTTDGSWAVVDEIVSTSELKTSALQGGTNNTWNLNDSWSVHRLATTLTDNDDTVDIPLMNDQTDANGDVSKTYNYPGSPVDIVVRIRSNEGATKYIPYYTSGQITGDGYTLTAVLLEDTVAT